MLRLVHNEAAKLLRPIDSRENDITANLQCSIIESLQKKPEVLTQYHHVLKRFPKGIVKNLKLSVSIYHSLDCNVGNEFHQNILLALRFLEESSEYSGKLRQDIRTNLFGTFKTCLTDIRTLHPKLEETEKLKPILEEVELMLRIVANILRESGPKKAKLFKKCELFEELKTWSSFKSSTVQNLACLVLFYSLNQWQQTQILRFYS